MAHRDGGLADADVFLTMFVETARVVSVTVSGKPRFVATLIRGQRNKSTELCRMGSPVALTSHLPGIGSTPGSGGDPEPVDSSHRSCRARTRSASWGLEDTRRRRCASRAAPQARERASASDCWPPSTPCTWPGKSPNAAHKVGSPGTLLEPKGLATSQSSDLLCTQLSSALLWDKGELPLSERQAHRSQPIKKVPSWAVRFQLSSKFDELVRDFRLPPNLKKLRNPREPERLSQGRVPGDHCGPRFGRWQETWGPKRNTMPKNPRARAIRRYPSGRNWRATNSVPGFTLCHMVALFSESR